MHYYFSDHLGSTSVVTNASGGIEEESDYYPWGRERVITDTLPDQNYKFTGKERDTESGLDFFIARYYSSQYGRFMSPDEFAGGPVDAFSSNDPAPSGALPYADITNPQSLNKYTYTYNNPLNYVDPNGRCPVCEAVEEVAVRVASNPGARSNWAGLLVLVVITSADVGSKRIANTLTENARDEERKDAIESQVAVENNKKLSQEREGDETLSRLGTEPESPGRLERKATESEQATGLHGVSVTAGPPRGAASSAPRKEVEKHFPVVNTPTKSDPLHRTVLLPKPVTKQAADTFNKVFNKGKKKNPGGKPENQTQ